MSAVPPPLSAAEAAARTAPAERRRHLKAIPNDEFFGRQPTSTVQLPDPTLLVENLARSVLEVMSGARDIAQIARWLDENVYRHVLRRSTLAARGRSARGAAGGRPVMQIAATRITSPADGVIEATVVLHGRVRTRAVAMRLEGMDSRWRATAIHVL